MLNRLVHITKQTLVYIIMPKKRHVEIESGRWLEKNSKIPRHGESFL